MEQESLLSDMEFTPVFASAGKRFLNYLIDIIVFDIIITVLKTFIIPGEDLLYTANNSSNNIFASLMISYLCFVVLYFLSELVFKGKTIGKLITGTKAVNEDGTEMKPKTVLIRSLCRIVPFEPFSAFSAHPWHDKWTRTCVIDIRKTELNTVSFQQ